MDTLTVSDIREVTLAHLLVGHAGKNGVHIAWVYPKQPVPKLIAGKFSLCAEGR